MIEFCNVSKDYNGKEVIKNISMTINDKELTVLIGPSGCGKTTTLKMINRLISISSGKILIDGKDIQEMNEVAMRRNIGYVIQNGGLFPHMTIRENIEIIEKLEGKDPKEILKRTMELMKMVDLNADEFLDAYPSEMSGGQQQRVGVIRALANDPDIILFDEPFSALDPVTRSNLQDELIELQRKVGKTMVFVTHDMDEAIKIADRICIMKDGNILQYDKPEVILKEPADKFIAEFVGTNRIWYSPEFIKVEDFMIKNPVTCHGDLERINCIRRMRNHHIDSLIVVDEDKHIRGIITRNSLFKADSDLTTAEHMMEPVNYIAHNDDNIVDVLQMIADTSINTLPVLNDKEKLVGLLTNSNLVSTLSKQFIGHESKEGGKS